MQEFSRDDTRREVYTNPASGSNRWTWSFTIEPFGPDIPHPDHWYCYASANIRLTEDGEWFENENIDAPNNSINYQIARQQPGDNDQSGSLQHGVIIKGNNDSSVGRMRGDVDDASNAERYDWYEENTEWDITISRR